MIKSGDTASTRALSAARGALSAAASVFCAGAPAGMSLSWSSPSSLLVEEALEGEGAPLEGEGALDLLVARPPVERRLQRRWYPRFRK